MSRPAPGGKRQADEREQPREGEVGDGARRADRYPPPSRLEPGLGRVHEGIREDHHSLHSGLLDSTPEGCHREPVRRLVRGDQGEAAQQEHDPAEADLARDHERRPVAPGHEEPEDEDSDRSPAQPIAASAGLVNRRQPPPRYSRSNSSPAAGHAFSRGVGAAAARTRSGRGLCLRLRCLLPPRRADRGRQARRAGARAAPGPSSPSKSLGLANQVGQRAAARRSARAAAHRSPTAARTARC